MTVEAANLGDWPTLILILFLVFLSGFVLDPIPIILIIIPIAMPLMKVFGFDPIWFCILFLMVIQTSYLTPPMTPAIFYLRGIGPPEITLMDVYRGGVPFIEEERAHGRRQGEGALRNPTRRAPDAANHRRALRAPRRLEGAALPARLRGD